MTDTKADKDRDALKERAKLRPDILRWIERVEARDLAQGGALSPQDYAALSQEQKEARYALKGAFLSGYKLGLRHGKDEAIETVQGVVHGKTVRTFLDSARCGVKDEVGLSRTTARGDPSENGNKHVLDSADARQDQALVFRHRLKLPHWLANIKMAFGRAAQ